MKMSLKNIFKKVIISELSAERVKIKSARTYPQIEF